MNTLQMLIGQVEEEIPHWESCVTWSREPLGWYEEYCPYWCEGGECSYLDRKLVHGSLKECHVNR